MIYFNATCLVESTGRLPEMEGMRVRDTLKNLATKQVRIILEEPKRYSSTSQREYYFKVIVEAWKKMLFEATDVYWDKEETHHYLMTEIGQWFKEPILVNGKKVLRRRSYRDLSTAETELHHTKCRGAGAQNGIQIPEPGEKIA